MYIQAHITIINTQYNSKALYNSNILLLHYYSNYVLYYSMTVLYYLYV